MPDSLPPSTISPIPPRLLAGRPMFPIGLGCMGMSEFYGASDDAQSLSTLHAALDQGVTHFDTADTYGFGHNETLLGRFLHELAPSQRSRLIVATKFGIVREPGRYERRIDNSPAYIRTACEASLRRLGVECINLYYCHRRDPAIPITEVAGTMVDLMREGKIRALGLSEVSEATLRAAHAVHPIAALQTEYSLWERTLEAGLLNTTRALGVALVAYSPLGRGMLTGTPPTPDTLDAQDFRHSLPRFNDQAGQANRQLAEQLRQWAEKWSMAPAQLALAWLLHRGPHVLPIPGARHTAHLAQNLSAATATLDTAQLETLNALFALDEVKGARYPSAGWTGIEPTNQI